MQEAKIFLIYYVSIAIFSMLLLISFGLKSKSAKDKKGVFAIIVVISSLTYPIVLPYLLIKELIFKNRT